jgi:hypothetical protein
VAAKLSGPASPQLMQGLEMAWQHTVCEALVIRRAMTPEDSADIPGHD